MARKSSENYLKQYKQKLEYSKRWRKDEGYDASWKRLTDLYKGRHYEHYSDEDRLLVNIVFSTINVIGPSIAINYPKIVVNAVKPENAPNAVIAEAVVNYWWRHRDVKTEFRRSVKDFLMYGHGWMKVGYRFVEEESVGGNEDVSDPIEGGESTSISVILEDSPFAERVSPMDVFVDSDATSMSDLRWIAQRVRRPIADVKSDKRYNKTAREAVGIMAVNRYADDPSRRKVYDKDSGYAEIWEYYDITTKTMSVFAEGGDTFLVKPTRMPYSFGHPFVMLRNYDIPDAFYPIGELEAIEPLQKELNETRTQMMNHRKRFARKYLYKESAFDQMGRTALESEQDNIMVPVISDEPLSNVVAPLPVTITPPEFYNQSNMIISDIDRISGLSEFMRGASTEIRRSATEASLMQDAANARTADKLATVEQAVAQVARRLVSLTQQFMSGEQVARIVTKNGESVWVTYDRDYLEGDFDFEVEAGSTQPQNESFRRQMALQLVDAMAPFAGAGIIDMSKLAAHVLQFGFGIKSPEQFMAPPAPPAGAPAPAGEPAGPPPPQGMPLPPQPSIGDTEITAAEAGAMGGIA
jgi:hypothetical protein